MNWVMAGRTVAETSKFELARAAVTKTGADTTVWVFTPT
jgi:hypothetical protein